jgi:hypothetical protein
MFRRYSTTILIISLAGCSSRGNFQAAKGMELAVDGRRLAVSAGERDQGVLRTGNASNPISQESKSQVESSSEQNKRELSEWVKESIIKHIESEKFAMNYNQVVGRYGVSEDPFMGEEIRKLVGYGALVQEIPDSGKGSIRQINYRIIKTNFFRLKEPAKNYTYDLYQNNPELTSTERYTLQEFIGMPPNKRGDSLAILKRKLKRGQKASLEDEIRSIIGDKGILDIADCNKRYVGGQRKCTAFEVFKK